MFIIKLQLRVVAILAGPQISTFAPGIWSIHLSSCYTWPPIRYCGATWSCEFLEHKLYLCEEWQGNIVGSAEKTNKTDQKSKKPEVEELSATRGIIFNYVMHV